MLASTILTSRVHRTSDEIPILSYLSKDKKDIKKLVLQFALKFLINISCFDEEAMGRAFHFVENLFKNE